MPATLSGPVAAAQTRRERRLARLSTGSRVGAVVCLLLALGLPAGVLWTLLALPPDALLRAAGAAPGRGAGAFDLATWQRVAVTLLGLWPAGCVSYALLQARRSLRSFASGTYFSVDATRGLRGLGSGLVLAAVAQLVVTPASSVILTYALGKGSRVLTLGLSSTMLMQLAMAGLVWLIAAVLAEAREIADEHAQFV